MLTALQKLPADRFGGAREFADALDGKGGTYAATVSLSSRPHVLTPSRPPRALVVAGAAVLIAALATWALTRQGGTGAPVSRQRVVLWQHARGRFLSAGQNLLATQAAIAPDGSSIVYTDSIGGVIQLMRKLRYEREPVPIAGTEGGVSPFFSPDGRWIGYVTTDGRLRKVSVDGGGSITIAEDAATGPRSQPPGSTTGPSCTAGAVTGLKKVPADGGASSPVSADSSLRRRLLLTLSPLPGSRGYLHTSCPGNCAIESAVYVFDFAADSSRLLVPNAAGVWYSPAGRLLYTDRAGGLYAAGFDPNRLVLTTPAVPVIQDCPDHPGAVGIGNCALLCRRRQAEAVRAPVGRARWHHGAGRLELAG